jgi:alpha-amylase/alpha-mannosidase (GH57 family)
MGKYICIHGHFYQPPRENAWLEQVELQDSAHPFHDWNERIASECYAPNTASRILDEEGVIKNIVNNYSRISFNFGPSLLSWLEINDPETHNAIVEADQKSRQYFSGHGSAMAQVYNHIIMPLANRRDKETQVKWGIADFKYRFGRKPEGMWLAETAVDTETLEILADHNITFTVLAPGQAKAVRQLGADKWQDVTDHSVDTTKPYLYQLPSGKDIVLYFYDGDVSQDVAFKGLLNNGRSFAESLISRFDKKKKEQLVHIATDGESYGHHHKHGDMALAYCLDYIERKADVRLTNYAEYLDKVSLEYEAQLQEESSWSCSHGIGRWREDCGCHTGGEPGWNQEWRKGLRQALDWLRDKLSELYEKEASLLFEDPWDVRNEYIQVILKKNSGNVESFLQKYLKVPTRKSKALRLLEMQRNSLLMFTSCGWFFNEISGIETTQILQYACRAIQLAGQEADADLEHTFIDLLREAKSNIPRYGDGAEIYIKEVMPTRLNLQRVGMHYAVATIFEEDPEDLNLFNYKVTNEYLKIKEAGVQKVAVGITTIKSKVTFSEKRFSFAVLYIGQHNIIGNISLNMPRNDFDEMHDQIVEAFERSNIGKVFSVMQRYFGPEKYNLWHLFKDEKRKVLNQIMEQNLNQVEVSFRNIYNRDYPLINALQQDNIPIPDAYNTTLKFVLNTDLRNTLNNDQIDLDELQRIETEFKKWNLQIDDSLFLEEHARRSVYHSLKKIQNHPGETIRLQRLNRFFEFLELFKLEPDLYQSQNLYFKISKNSAMPKDEIWWQEFRTLGYHLGVKISN